MYPTMDAKESPKIDPEDAAIVAGPIKQIGYDFIKSNMFRVVYVDGVFGGLSPSGMITAAMFNERFPIPKHVEHEVTPSGLGKELQREERNSVVREVEVELVLSIDGARVLRRWLDEKIGHLEALQTQMRDAESRGRQQ